MAGFPNMAGRENICDALAAELEAAGIEVSRLSVLKNGRSEVDTEVIGGLHGWKFERAWYYWRCDGPGIEVSAAERLHATHGKDVRVARHCGCPSPTEWYKGLAVGDYHVDTPEGLRALVDTIKQLVANAPAPSETPATYQEPVTWQRRLMYDGKNWGRWHECTEDKARFAQQSGFPEGFRELKAEVRSLYAKPVAVADVRGRVIEEAVRIAHEWADKMAKNNGRETANTIADRIRALQQQAGR